MNPAPHVVLVFFLLAFSAFFSASETALFSLSSIEKRQLEGRQDRASRKILNLLDHPRRTLIAILIGNNLVNILASAIMTLLALNWFGDRGVGVTIGVFTIVLLLLGEIIPKSYAARHNKTLARLVAYPLDVFAKVIFPVRRVVRLITDFLLSFIIKEKRSQADRISESELKALIKIGEEQGILEADERRRLVSLIDLGERRVKEIMTPCVEMVSFNMREPIDRLVDVMRQYHYSHLPVYLDSLDNMIGVVKTQDFLLSGDRRLDNHLLPSYYIPETKRISDLLREFRQAKNRFALCVEEYGGITGLVTLEDILEEVFGEIYDEYAKESFPVERLSRDEFLVDARTPLKEINHLLGMDLSSKRSETLSGFLLEALGRIPKPKESFQWRDYLFEAREVSMRRILKVYIRRRPPNEP